MILVMVKHGLALSVGRVGNSSEVLIVILNMFMQSPIGSLLVACPLRG